VDKILGTLPAGYRPSGNTPFVANTTVIDGSSNRVEDDTAVGYIDQTNMYLAADGQIGAQMKQPASGVAGYYIQFSVVIPLD
jgi:hypothetical protein